MIFKIKQLFKYNIVINLWLCKLYPSFPIVNQPIVLEMLLQLYLIAILVATIVANKTHLIDVPLVMMGFILILDIVRLAMKFVLLVKTETLIVLFIIPIVLKAKNVVWVSF